MKVGVVEGKEGERKSVTNMDSETKRLMKFTDVHIAVNDHDEAALRKLYSCGADLNAPDVGGNTAVHLAAGNRNHVKMLRVLHELGADVDARNNTGDAPVHNAAYFHDVDMLRVLHELGADFSACNANGYTPAHEALLNRDGRDVNGVLSTLHKMGVDLNKMGYGKWDHPCHKGYAPVHIAAERNDVNAVHVLHELGANLNAFAKAGKPQKSPAHIAAIHGHDQMLFDLHTLGADLSAREPGEGMTPAHHAARNNQEFCLWVLHRLGAEINARNTYGNAPMHCVARDGSTGMIRVFHEIGTDLNMLNNSGEAVMHDAILRNRPDIIRVLHELGADVDVRKGYAYPAGVFETPLSKAIEFNRVDLIRLLCELGADACNPDIEATDTFDEVRFHDRMLAQGRLCDDYESDVLKTRRSTVRLIRQLRIRQRWRRVKEYARLRVWFTLETGAKVQGLVEMWCNRNGHIHLAGGKSKPHLQHYKRARLA